jgi:hypothetical protein
VSVLKLVRWINSYIRRSRQEPSEREIADIHKRLRELITHSALPPSAAPPSAQPSKESETHTWQLSTVLRSFLCLFDCYPEFARDFTLILGDFTFIVERKGKPKVGFLSRYGSFRKKTQGDDSPRNRASCFSVSPHHRNGAYRRNVALHVLAEISHRAPRSTFPCSATK